MPWMGKTKQTVLSEFRRGEILEAARKTFASKGFTDTTLDEIAAEAGVAKGTIYLYFPSKRDIYMAALKNGIEELNVFTREAIAQAQGTAAKLRAFIHTRVHYAEQHRDFFKIYHHEVANIVHPSAVDPDLRDICRRNAEMVKSILDRGVDLGEVRPISTATAGHMIYDLTRSLIATRLLGWSQDSAEHDIETACNLVWKGIAL